MIPATALVDALPYMHRMAIRQAVAAGDSKQAILDRAAKWGAGLVLLTAIAAVVDEELADTRRVEGWVL